MFIGTHGEHYPVLTAIRWRKKGTVPYPECNLFSRPLLEKSAKPYLPVACINSQPPSEEIKFKMEPGG